MTAGAPQGAADDAAPARRAVHAASAGGNSAVASRGCRRLVLLGAAARGALGKKAARGLPLVGDADRDTLEPNISSNSSTSPKPSIGLGSKKRSIRQAEPRM